MNWPQIDTHLFKSFMAAAETENFTLAAIKARLTQSGVSQHIAALENQLGVSLFERINKKVRLTAEGKELRNFIETYADGISSVIERISQKKTEIQGLVSYAMPASCLKTPHFPMLLEKHESFSGVDLKITLAPNDEIIEALINGEIDFGFVTRRSENPALDQKVFATEEYCLIGKLDFISAIDSKSLTTTPFVSYPGMDVLLGYWAHRYFPKLRNFSSRNIYRKGEINDLDAAITMVLRGFGVSVFPKHCIAEFLSTKKVVEYRRANLQNPTEDIFLIKRAQTNYPRRVVRVIDAFWEMKA